MRNQDKKKKTTRYNVNLPPELLEEMKKIAIRKHTSIAEILKQFIKLGLIIASTPDASFIIRESDKERQIMLL